MSKIFKTQIRLNEELGYELRKLAEKNMRSLNSEMAVRLKRSVDADRNQEEQGGQAA